MNASVSLGIPLSWPYVSQKFCKYLLMMNKSRTKRIIWSDKCNTAEGRNQIVKIFLKTDDTHLLFLDADNIHPPDIIERLLKHNKDIVGGFYFTKSVPRVPLVMEYKGKNVWSPKAGLKKGLNKCSAVATGALIIARKVFNKIPYPWFDYAVNQEEKAMVTEDLVFCRKAKLAGFSVFVDTTIQVGHLKEIVI